MEETVGGPMMPSSGRMLLSLRMWIGHSWTPRFTLAQRTQAGLFCHYCFGADHITRDCAL